MNRKPFKKTSPHTAHRLLKTLAVAGLALMASSPPAQADYCYTTNTEKWLQPPQVYQGFDVLDSHGIILADDFLCTNAGVVTDIHLWGSWQNDQVGSISNFYLFIYSNVPVGPNNPTNYSQPGTLLWQQTFQPGQYSSNIYTNGSETFWDPSNNFSATDETVWQFCFQPLATNPFPQTGSVLNPIVYWLVAYADGVPSTNHYGWKSSTTNWNDAAVWCSWNGLTQEPAGSWTPMYNPTNTGKQLDLSFEIFNSTNIPTTNCCYTTNQEKWYQPPQINQGFDVQDCQGIVLADDFLCTNTGFISEIYLWGSWSNDLAGSINTFYLFIYSNMPAGPPAGGFSQPGTLLWQQAFPPGQYCSNFYTSGNEMFWNPSNYMFGSDLDVWQFCFVLPATNPFYQTGTPASSNVYWLVAYAGGVTNTTDYGWKSSTTNWNDAAVWGGWNDVIQQPLGNWAPMYNPTNSTKQLDLSFEIFNSTNIPTTNCCYTTNQQKFYMPPNFYGIDVQDSQGIVLADDFLCASTGFISTIYLWGSWWEDQVGSINNFYLFIYSDVPASSPSNTLGYSYPGTLLWREKFPAGQFCSNALPAGQEYFLNPSNILYLPETIPWQFCFEPTNPYYQTGTPASSKVYWLVAFAGGLTNTNVFGWKTSTSNWNDAAVWNSWNSSIHQPVGIWKPIPNPFVAGQQLDLSFELFNSTNINCTPPFPIPYSCSEDKQVYCGTNWTFDPPLVWVGPCCPTAPNVIFNGAVTNGFCPMIATATWTITDCLGQTAVCTQNVTMIDAVRPLLICSSNITVTTCTSNAQAFWTVWSWDGCGGTNVTVTCNPTNGSFFNADTTNTVNVTSVDLCDNITNTCSFTVAVVRPVLGPITYTIGVGPSFTLHWANGILQSCTNLSPANWVDVPGASPPSFTTNFGRLEEFFRLRCQSP